eukprot:1141387-Pelagomonas_calceolata.AAC.1
MPCFTYLYFASFPSTQASDAGLIGGSEKPIGRRHIPGKSNISSGPAAMTVQSLANMVNSSARGGGYFKSRTNAEGLSSSTDGDGFPLGFRHGGPHKNSYSHVVQRDEGIVQIRIRVQGSQSLVTIFTTDRRTYECSLSSSLPLNVPALYCHVSLKKGKEGEQAVTNIHHCYHRLIREMSKQAVQDGRGV